MEQGVVTKLRAISETAGGTLASCFVVCFVGVGSYCNTIAVTPILKTYTDPTTCQQGIGQGTFSEGDVVGAGEFFKT